jgi:hypothetical protein
MRNAKMVVCLGVVATFVGVSTVGVADDNCGGYHVNMRGMHVNLSDDPALSIHLALGREIGSQIQMKDKDGDEYTFVSTDPGADGRGAWKFVSGAGKYVNAKWFDWWKVARAEGDVSVTVWGGTCK